MAKYHLNKIVSESIKNLTSNTAIVCFKTVYSIIEVQRTITNKILQNGFEKCGLSPFNPNQVRSNELLNKNITQILDDTNVGLLLTSDDNRLQIYNNESYETANDVNENKCHNFESITLIFCYGQRSCGYSLSKFPSLLKKLHQINTKKSLYKDKNFFHIFILNKKLTSCLNYFKVSLNFFKYL